MANEATNPADGKFVVIEGGQRVSKPLDTKEQADEEAAKRNRLAEASGQPNPAPAQVKQNLFG